MTPPKIEATVDTMGKILVVVMAAMTVLPTSASAQPEPAPDALVTALRQRIRTDPVWVMTQLGVSIDDFDPIMRTMYAAWHARHPDAYKAKTAPAADGSLGHPIEGDESGWWCMTHGSAASCVRDQSSCEILRSQLGEFSRCDAYVEPVKAACIQSQADTNTVGSCLHESVAACFVVKKLLDGSEEVNCTPSIATCNGYRSYYATSAKQDYRVETVCKAVR